MKTNKQKKRVPESAFIKAACKYLKCKRDQLTFSMINDYHEALVIYNDEQYVITTKAAIRDYIQFQLTDINAALHINIYTWIQATENTVTIERFLPKLIDKLKNGEEAQLLQLALCFNSHTKDQYQTFWITLIKIDKHGELLGKAIVSAREEYSGFGLLDDLTELTIINGINDLNMLQDGIFAGIYLDDESPEFYIYSADNYSVNQ